jgi:8-oxo-dGTP diphosphatase
MPTEPDGARELRVAAYTICIEDGMVLLARWVGPDGPRWTLPGGGIDHGEDPADAALRELTEETGYVGRLDRLLGIDSNRARHPRPGDRVADFHGLRVVYAGTIVGGSLTYELDGSTDRAEWIPLTDVATLDRVNLVDRGLALAEQQPPSGHLDRRRVQSSA